MTVLFVDWRAERTSRIEAVVEVARTRVLRIERCMLLLSVAFCDQDFARCW